MHSVLCFSIFLSNLYHGIPILTNVLINIFITHVLKLNFANFTGVLLLINFHQFQISRFFKRFHLEYTGLNSIIQDYTVYRIMQYTGLYRI